MPVLVDKAGREAGQVTGRSPYLTAVHMDGPLDLVGKIVPARIVSARTNSVAGEIAA
jgi:tRNA-2-methylthio-N6-dimethylallyladenosine synthase